MYEYVPGANLVELLVEPPSKLDESIIAWICLQVEKYLIVRAIENETEIEIYREREIERRERREERGER